MKPQPIFEQEMVGDESSEADALAFKLAHLLHISIPCFIYLFSTELLLSAAA